MIVIGAEHLGEMEISKIAEAENMTRGVNKLVPQKASTVSTSVLAQEGVNGLALAQGGVSVLAQ